MMKAKEFKTTICVGSASQVVAYSISLMGRLWAGDIEKVLRAVAAYYGFGIVKL